MTDYLNVPHNSFPIWFGMIRLYREKRKQIPPTPYPPKIL